MTTTDCVLWTGHIEQNGYGKRGHIWVHREALAERLGRPIAAGMDACHTCDVRACINGDHLYEGTRSQNMADASARGRHNKPTGEAHWRAKLSVDDVLAIRTASTNGETCAVIGRRFGVHPATVSRIARGIWRMEVAAS